MDFSSIDTPPVGGPASAVIAAAQRAKTPLAVADARDASAPILFANEAFGEFVGVSPDALVGRSLATLGTSASPVQVRSGTVKLDVSPDAGRSMPAALSIAAVTGADGDVFCWLCSLIDARGENADAAMTTDGQMLQQVARAASELMTEAAAAARVAGTPGGPSAATIAAAAVEQVQQRADGGGA